MKINQKKYFNYSFVIYDMLYNGKYFNLSVMHCLDRSNEEIHTFQTSITIKKIRTKTGVNNKLNSG